MIASYDALAAAPSHFLRRFFDGARQIIDGRLPTHTAGRSRRQLRRARRVRRRWHVPHHGSRPSQRRLCHEDQERHSYALAVAKPWGPLSVAPSPTSAAASRSQQTFEFQWVKAGHTPDNRLDAFWCTNPDFEQVRFAWHVDDGVFWNSPPEARGLARQPLSDTPK